MAAVDKENPSRVSESRPDAVIETAIDDAGMRRVMKVNSPTGIVARGATVYGDLDTKINVKSILLPVRYHATQMHVARSQTENAAAKICSIKQIRPHVNI